MGLLKYINYINMILITKKTYVFLCVIISLAKTASVVVYTLVFIKYFLNKRHQ